MVRKRTRITTAAGAMAMVCCFLLIDTGQAQAGDHYTSPGLFYNYYAPTGPYGGVGTQLYVSPQPTPPLVGHTYVTYPPLMPHEWLYPHSRTYVRCNPGSGVTRTSVMWTHSLFDFGRLHRGPTVLPSPPLPSHGARYHAGWVWNN